MFGVLYSFSLRVLCTICGEWLQTMKRPITESVPFWVQDKNSCLFQKMLLLLFMNKPTQYVTKAGIIAAIYATLTVFLAPLSYGPIQIRFAEALTVLAFLMSEAIWGLWIGCMVANIYGGLGPIDIFGGSFITLLAAAVTFNLRKLNKPILAPLPPVIFNAVGVSAYLHVLIAPPPFSLFGFENIPPFLLFVITIGIGEFIACYGLGYPLLLILRRRFQNQI